MLEPSEIAISSPQQGDLSLDVHDSDSTLSCSSSDSDHPTELELLKKEIEAFERQQKLFEEYRKKTVHLPSIRFPGEIIEVDTSIQVSSAMKLIKHEKIVGFDMEWKPNTLEHQQNNPIALIQISGSSICILFRMLKIGFMPRLLSELLMDENIIKVGHTVDNNDATKLEDNYNVIIKNIVDVKEVAKQQGYYPLGLKALTGTILKRYLDKSLAVSNWENVELSREQKNYAATDAWVTRQLYLTLVSGVETPMSIDCLGDTKSSGSSHSHGNGSPGSCLRCLVCDKEFHSKLALKQHLRDKNHYEPAHHHNTHNSLPNSPQLSSSSSSCHFSKRIKKMSFSGSSIKVTAVTPVASSPEHKKVRKERRSSFSEGISCTVCSRGFHNKKALLQHVRDKQHQSVTTSQTGSNNSSPLSRTRSLTNHHNYVSKTNVSNNNSLHNSSSSTDSNLSNVSSNSEQMTSHDELYSSDDSSSNISTSQINDTMNTSDTQSDTLPRTQSDTSLSHNCNHCGRQFYEISALNQHQRDMCHSVMYRQRSNSNSDGEYMNVSSTSLVMCTYDKESNSNPKRNSGPLSFSFSEEDLMIMSGSSSMCDFSEEELTHFDT